MIDRIFDGSLMPHGHCLLWREDLLFMTLLGDGLTVLAYSLIPLALIHLVNKRADLQFDRIFYLFAGFIAFCGLSHAVAIVNVWQGFYFIQGFIKLITGAISILTALLLWRLIPSILAIPSMEELNKQNEALLDAKERLELANQNLEDKVKKRTASLQQLANTDQLTSINNRRAILQELDDEFERIQRDPHNLSLLMIDIDHFKKINDTLGHIEGDKTLVNVANLLVETCRKTDKLGRYGGEEFLIMLPKTNMADAKEFAEKIRIAVSQSSAKSVIPLSCSIGVAELEKDQTIIDLIKIADDRVYRAKDLGRNLVVHSS